MGRRLRRGFMLLAVAIGLPLLTVGCAEHHYYRAYDPYYSDDHRWDTRETVSYREWIVETHRDPHRDYRKLSREEQRE